MQEVGWQVSPQLNLEFDGLNFQHRLGFKHSAEDLKLLPHSQASSASNSIHEASFVRTKQEIRDCCIETTQLFAMSADQLHMLW